MRKAFIRTALAAASLVGLSVPAHAYVIVSFQDTQGPVTGTASCNTSAGQVNIAGGNCSTTDGFAGYAANGNNITFSGTVGDILVTQSALTNNFPGDAINGFNVSSQSSFRSSAAGTNSLMVDVSVVGFTAPNSPIKNLFGSATMNSVGSQSATGNEVGTFFLDANSITCSTSVSAGIQAGSCTAPSQQFASLNPYTLRSTQLFTNLTTNDTFTGSATVSVTVPEPMTTALVGSALVALALTSRRRKSAQRDA